MRPWAGGFPEGDQVIGGLAVVEAEVVDQVGVVLQTVLPELVAIWLAARATPTGGPS